MGCSSGAQEKKKFWIVDLIGRIGGLRLGRIVPGVDCTETIFIFITRRGFILLYNFTVL